MTFAPDTYATLADLSRAFAPPAPSHFDDQSLLEAQRSLAEIRKRADAAAAAVAGEIEHRSRRELGYDGLAQRLGARTPQKLVQTITGFSAREARSLVTVGGMLETVRRDPDASPSVRWLVDVAADVATGRLSIHAAEAIRAGLGTPNDQVTAVELQTAAALLLHDASSLTVEALAERARELRNTLDLTAVRDREQHRRNLRYLRLTRHDDGMIRLAALLDPESASIVVSALDAATSPRRGGPRFVDEKGTARAQRILDDPRTTDQLALDAFVELLTLATKADDGTILGTREPAVQVVVTAHDLSTGLGLGFLHGSHEAIGIDTVKRHICEAGTAPVLFDGDRPLDVGRSQRLFTPRQRKALAVRDGGCRFPDCDRPPSWTEAHHITEWQYGGRTDVADGILLCRHHHLLVHNNGWQVLRKDHDYLLRPPIAIDEHQAPLTMPAKSPPIRRLAAVTA